MTTILGWFSGAETRQASGVAAAFILFFDRLAKLTPSDSDNKIVAFIQKVFAVLGVKVPDVQ